jgi:prophage regulatory protein
MADRFIGGGEVAHIVGLSKSEIYRRIGAGEFPRQVPLGEQRVAFLASEIETWMAERITARDLQEGSVDRRERARKAKVRQ